jgi:sugar phosphate isomerase/epimerase
MSTKHDLSRRRFLGAAGGVAAAGALGPFAGVAGADHRGWRRGRENEDFGFGKGGDIPLDRIGIQLFTVRDLLADNELDLPGTFEMLADAGYALVEVGGTYDMVGGVPRTAAEFKALADQYGLEPEGSHVPRGIEAWRTDRATIFADAKTLGLTYVGLASPGDTPQTHEAYAALAAEFDQWGEEARAQGLKFYFHNHPGDFALDGGTPIYDTLLAETDPKLVFFELDIAWIEAGGQSAYEYIRRHGPSRFPLFHVKDLRFDPEGNRTTPPNVAQPGRPFFLTAVGKGGINFGRIFSELRDLDDHEYLVEDDDAPNPVINPAGQANTAWVSRKYLAELNVPRHR